MKSAIVGHSPSLSEQPIVTLERKRIIPYPETNQARSMSPLPIPARSVRDNYHFPVRDHATNSSPYLENKPKTPSFPIPTTSKGAPTVERDTAASRGI